MSVKKLSKTDDLFRQRLEKEFNDALPRAPLKERAKLRDAAKDAAAIDERMKASSRRDKERRQLAQEQQQEEEARRTQDRAKGRQNQRLTQVRLGLRKELLKKVREKELHGLMAALPSALETLSVAEFFGANIGSEGGVQHPAKLSEQRKTPRRTEEEERQLLSTMGVKYVYDRLGNKEQTWHNQAS